jgi:hypothetical protein
VADTDGMDVGDTPQELVGIKLDQKGRHCLAHLQILLHHSVHGLWNIVHDHIQVHFVWLLPRCEERLPHLYTVRVAEHFQDLELSVFVSFVLEDLLDCDCFPCLRNGRFEDNSE